MEWLVTNNTLSPAKKACLFPIPGNMFSFLDSIQTRTLPGLPRWLTGKESSCQRRCGFNPRIGKIPWRRAWQPTPVFLPGESHGQRSLEDYSPWGHKELNVTEHSTALSTFAMWFPVFIEFPQIAPRCSSLQVFAHAFPSMCCVFWLEISSQNCAFIRPNADAAFSLRCPVQDSFHSVLSSQHHWLCILCSLRSPVHHDKCAPRHDLFPTQMVSPCPTHLSSFLKVCSRSCHMAETENVCSIKYLFLLWT